MPSALYRWTELCKVSAGHGVQLRRLATGPQSSRETDASEARSRRTCAASGSWSCNGIEALAAELVDRVTVRRSCAPSVALFLRTPCDAIESELRPPGPESQAPTWTFTRGRRRTSYDGCREARSRACRPFAELSGASPKTRATLLVRFAQRDRARITSNARHENEKKD